MGVVLLLLAGGCGITGSLEHVPTEPPADTWGRVDVAGCTSFAERVSERGDITNTSTTTWDARERVTYEGRDEEAGEENGDVVYGVDGVVDDWTATTWREDDQVAGREHGDVDGSTVEAWIYDEDGYLVAMEEDRGPDGELDGRETWTWSDVRVHATATWDGGLDGVDRLTWYTYEDGRVVREERGTGPDAWGSDRVTRTWDGDLLLTRVQEYWTDHLDEEGTEGWYTASRLTYTYERGQLVASERRSGDTASLATWIRDPETGWVLDYEVDDQGDGEIDHWVDYMRDAAGRTVVWTSDDGDSGTIGWTCD